MAGSLPDLMLAHVPPSGGGTHETSADDREKALRGREPFDTCEVRWFAPGPLPSSLVAWFVEGPASLEIRRDRYRMDGTPGFGLKQRDRGPMEAKFRSTVADAGQIGGGLRGRIEEWRKYAPVSEDDLPGAERWTDVDKIVLTRSYRRGPDGVVRPIGARDLSTPGCDVELVAVTVGEVEAWSFALESWGPAVLRRSVLRDAMAAVAGDGWLPADLVSALGEDVGYPEWLAALTGTRPTRRPT